MSQTNRDNDDAEDPREELCNSSEPTSSTTSSCASTITSSTSTSETTGSNSSSNSESESGSTSGSDNEQCDSEGHHKHRQHRHCRKSKGCHPNDPSLADDHNNEDHHDDDARDRLDANEHEASNMLQATTGHTCDTRIMTNCPRQTTTRSEVPTTRICEHKQHKQEGQTNCQFCLNVKNMTTSPPLLQTPPQHRCTSSQALDTQDTHHQSCSLATQPETRLTISEKHNSKHDRHRSDNMQPCHLNTAATSLGYSYSNLSSTSTSSTLHESTTTGPSPRRILKPAPSPSPSLSTIETANKSSINSSSTSARDEGLSSLKRTSFSKSASGSRLINRSRPNICDCLKQDCGEKKHSNRRQFIEHYYNSRTQLPTANTSTSSFNISTPLNTLSECDAITRRLLSSPIRTTTNLVESPTHQIQVISSDLDKSRRASLGTNTVTDQVFLFASNQFKSLESSFRKSRDISTDNQQQRCDPESAHTSGENDVKSKQQQGRSLSVCDEETMNPRGRSNSSNHSTNLSRTISLACESGPSPSARRLLTIIPLFGCDMKSLEQFTRLGMILPPVIDSAVDYILVNGINSIGIFRKSGVKSRILSLRQRIETNQNLKFNELDRDNEYSIYDIADLVKMWFRELKPVPLMTKELIKLISSFLNAARPTNLKRGNSSHQESMVTSRGNLTTIRHIDPILKSKIDSLLTQTHRALLYRALNFFHQISSKCGTNQMTSQNLAICLTPSLCATESDQNSILISQKALEYCIENGQNLFVRT